MASIAAQNDPKILHAASLIAEGVKPIEAGRRAGLSASYIVELKEKDWFLNIVASNARANDTIKGVTKAGQIDELYDHIEMRLLKTVNENLEVFGKPAMLERLLKTVNSAKRRSEGEAKPINPEQMKTRLVEIKLPAFMQQHMISSKKNENNEVIEVAGRTLVTQNSDVLLKKVQGMENENKQNFGAIKLQEDEEPSDTTGNQDIIDLF